MIHVCPVFIVAISTHVGVGVISVSDTIGETRRSNSNRLATRRRPRECDGEDARERDRHNTAVSTARAFDASSWRDATSEARSGVGTATSEKAS